MKSFACRYCGSLELSTKEVNILCVNAKTMKIASSERVCELECMRCGWHDAITAFPQERLAFAPA